MGIKARVRTWLGIEELGTKIDELKEMVMGTGLLGVGAAIARAKTNHDQKPLRSRLAECRKGHGVVGQVFSEWQDEWIGGCKDCGDCPKGDISDEQSKASCAGQ
jgi:hypothetical protein